MAMKHSARLLAGAAVALAALSARLPAADDPPNSTPANQAAPTPDEALQRLKEGNARFVADMPKEAEPGSKRRIELSQGQRPIAVVLTCSDSRAAPEFIFDKGLGVLFVVRVAGNVGGPEVYASIEYAVAELKTPLVVVLGHTRCGAVAAALKAKDPPSEFLRQLVSQIRTGGDSAGAPRDAVDAAARNNARHQAALLPRQSRIVEDFVAGGRAKIVPAFYDLKTGVVEWLEPAAK
jgi:carbonic anhydrase